MLNIEVQIEKSEHRSKLYCIDWTKNDLQLCGNIYIIFSNELKEKVEEVQQKSEGWGIKKGGKIRVDDFKTMIENC